MNVLVYSFLITFILVQAATPSNEMVSQLIETQKTIDEKMAESDVALFSGSVKVRTFPQDIF